MPVLRVPGRVDALALHRLAPRRYPFLMESAAFHAERGRWDILACAPREGWVLEGDGRVRDLDGRIAPGSFLGVLEQRRRACAVLACPEAASLPLPFAGGWALFLSYEFAAQVEPVLALPDAPEGVPVALALRCAGAVLVDRCEGAVWLVADRGEDALIAQLQADLARVFHAAGDAPLRPQWLSEAPEAAYLHAVERALDYIVAGDVFQVNLSRRWELGLPSGAGAADVHAALRRANPAPFGGLLAWDDWAIISSSPERLVAVRGDVVQTRPIAGTRPRVTGDDERDRRRELIGHPKERAEHIMLIDLERNDLGRVCRAGTVEVNELMAVESYAHVHHIVSNVRGRLRADVASEAVLAAVFPGGTITGCPKVRCMQIIAELEGQGRGAYTGSFGYLGHDGRMDLNILIRTLTLRHGVAAFRAGAGIVADSQPGAELAETRAKARGLLRAFGMEG